MLLGTVYGVKTTGVIFNIKHVSHDVYLVFFVRDPFFFLVKFVLSLFRQRESKDRVREEDSLLLLLSGFRDYHKDSELTLIQRDCHSS